MQYYSSLAFVLKQKPVKEHDRCYTFYTQKYGKLNLMASGARKINAKLAGHLEIPSLVRIEFTMTHNPRLITALEQISYLKIKKRKKPLSVAFLITDLVNRFVLEKQPDLEIWKLLDDVFYFLEQNVDKFPEIAEFSWLYFNAQFLQILGLAPFLEACVECGGKTNVNAFSFRKRGLVCRLHREKDDLLISSNQRKFLNALFSNSLKNFFRISLIKQILTEKKYLHQFLDKFTLIIESDII